MADINKIIDAIDQFLEERNLSTISPVEINPILERKGILNDSSSRPGLPKRNILRDNLIPYAYQTGNRWVISHSGNKSNSISLNIKTGPVLKVKISKTVSSTNKHKLEPIFCQLQTVINLL